MTAPDQQGASRRLQRLGHTPEEIAARLALPLADVEDLLGLERSRPRPVDDDGFPTFELDTDLAWVDDALCREVDNDIFFPEKGGSTREAKALCRQCPALQPCLDYALRHGERFGIWGGHSVRERRRLRGAS